MQCLATPFVQAAVDGIFRAMEGVFEGTECSDTAHIHAAEQWQLTVSTVSVWSPWVDSSLLTRYLQVGCHSD